MDLRRVGDSGADDDEAMTTEKKAELLAEYALGKEIPDTLEGQILFIMTFFETLPPSDTSTNLDEITYLVNTLPPLCPSSPKPA